MKQRKFISGYFLLDYKELSKEEQQQVNIITKQYTLEWQMLKQIGSRQLYFCVMRSSKYLENQFNEEGEIIMPSIMSVFAPRNPEILGIWNMDGSYLGTTKNIIPPIYDEETGELIADGSITYSGTPLYPLLYNKYLQYMNDIPDKKEIINGEEVVISWKRPTICKPIRIFGGFESPLMED